MPPSEVSSEILGREIPCQSEPNPVCLGLSALQPNTWYTVRTQLAPGPRSQSP